MVINWSMDQMGSVHPSDDAKNRISQVEDDIESDIMFSKDFDNVKQSVNETGLKKKLILNKRSSIFKIIVISQITQYLKFKSTN